MIKYIAKTNTRKILENTDREVVVIKYIAKTNTRKIFLISDHPRAELLKELESTHAEKIYQDVNGKIAVHVGYYICGEYWTILKISGFIGE